MTRTQAHEPHAPGLARTIGDDRARVEGPTLVVIGGLHANEPAGIEAARRVHDAVGEGAPRLDAGRLVSLRGNLTALATDTTMPRRYIDEDLNRAFTGETGLGDDATVEQRERAELATALAEIVSEATHAVYLLDLHTVSSDSPAFMVLEDSLAARRFARAFPLAKILGLEEELPGLLIDDATQRLGCVSCIIESGRHDDPRSADVHEALILIAMEHLGMVTPGSLTSAGEDPRSVAKEAAGPRAGHYYDLRQRIGIAHESFAMLPDAVAFSRVRAKRTVLATERSKAITAEADGLLFMPNRQDERRVGEDGFFVIQRVGNFWLGVSEVLRRRERLHRLLPVVLPGVRRRSGDPHAILVAPEYAAILRREILHLLGYRLIRWTHTRYLTRRQRIMGGIGALLRSCLGILRRAATGGERSALPEERETDWIARRHRLDTQPPRPARTMEQP